MKRYQRSNDWLGSQVDDSFVMLNIDSGNYVALNSTATAIWDRLVTPQTQDEIVEALLTEFDVERSACANSVARSLAEMEDMQLVVSA